MSEQNEAMLSEEQELSQLLQVRREKLAHLIEAGKNPYEETSYERTAYSKQILDNFEEFEGKKASLAGRIMSRRDMGKACFMDIADSAGRIQTYIRADQIGVEEYELVKKWDIGDIIGLEGEVFRTKHGEISIRAEKVILLSKSLLPLPEKWHGLKDTETRYRQRYVDLIVNPDVRDTFEKRSKIIKEIRNFLDNKSFLEVETPILQTIVGGATAKPFFTHHNTLDIEMNLRIAPELNLKRLIVGGFDKVYEIGRNFRNEGISVRHNPEFTMLELYEAYTDYVGMMNLTEELIRTVAKNVLGRTQLVYNEKELDLGKPFPRISMVDCVKEHAGVDFTTVDTLEAARSLAKTHNIKYEERHGKGDILNLFFEEYCEDKLNNPTFIIDYPVEISPLSKRISGNPEYTQRFELFILGREYANAYSELNDPIDQKERFEHQVSLQKAGDDEATDMDDDFITAMEYAMPPTGGMGMGIDRLVMLLTDSYSIRDVLLFPTMKSHQ